MRVSVISVGYVDTDILVTIVEAVEQDIPGTEANIIPEIVSMPPDAYSSTRNQYDSRKILDKLLDYSKFRNTQSLLGVTNEDLFTPGMNFIFGQAMPRTGIAVISINRLRYGLDINFVRDLFLDRVSKEAFHELGHLMGLRHCPDPNCVMHFSNTLGDTDSKSTQFCKRCSSKI